MASPGRDTPEKSPDIHPVSGKCRANEVSGSKRDTIADSSPRSSRMQIVTKKIVAST